MRNHEQTYRKSFLYFILLITVNMINAQYTLQDADVTVENGILTECLTDTGDWGTSDIIIPESLYNHTIVGIADKQYGNGVFESMGITKVVLPSTLKTIGNWAFQDNLLQGITIPAGVDSIKDKVFAHNSFEEIIFETNSSLVFIGDNAFAYNRSGKVLDSVNFPKKLNYIDEMAFYCNQIDKIIFEKTSSLKYIGTCAFDRSRVTDLTLPDSLAYIGPLAFIRNSLSTVQLPRMVTYIGIYAFDEGGISTIDLPNPVIKQDSTFSEWQNSNGLKVTQITDHTLSYTAKFNLGESIFVQNNINSEETQVYPNPTSNIINIQGYTDVEKVILIDLTGKIILEKTVGDYIETLDITGLPNGIYILKISKENSTDNVKILKSEH